MYKGIEAQPVSYLSGPRRACIQQLRILHYPVNEPPHSFLDPRARECADGL